jgi:hypothetical protein
MMKPSPDLPHLQIIATSKLHPHELPDEQRAGPLAKSIRRDRVLRNPPIVLPIEDQDGEYVVLDGANRVTALKLLDVPFALVQVAHPNGDSVQVRTWNHILLEEVPSQIEGLLRSINGFGLRTVNREQAHQSLQTGESLVNIEIRQGPIYTALMNDHSLQGRIEGLGRFVAAYVGEIHFERTSSEQLGNLLDVYQDAAGLVVFPEFEPTEVVRGAASGWHFPPGITRFIVSPRALRVNYPLEMLSGDGGLEDKQAHLDEWIRVRMRNRRVRYYAESTFLFDE